ncbi:MAG: helix-turn-helix transcriptional regulator [Alistipes sp.]|nr:helix-turn-helix transcriptional regulator [Alistipes sp.]
MREKLLNLMKSEQLTASKLAELLDIQPSGISHILSGRNKPSFDLVQKILRRFPRVNPDWLLLDKDEMYRTIDIEPQPATSQSISTEELDETMQQSTVSGMTASATNPTSASTPAQQIAAAYAPKNGNVKRVIILFDDHTFESYEVSR